MVSYEQLGRTAYEAYWKQTQKEQRAPMDILPWDKLEAQHKASWIATAKALVAEMRTVL
nr:hypothetical protein [uncultured Albidiferax sp.]